MFDWLQRTGGIADHELRRTFNCGVGLTLIVSPDNIAVVLEAFARAGEDAFIVGELAEG